MRCAEQEVNTERKHKKIAPPIKLKSQLQYVANSEAHPSFAFVYFTVFFSYCCFDKLRIFLCRTRDIRMRLNALKMAHFGVGLSFNDRQINSIRWAER